MKNWNQINDQDQKPFKAVFRQWARIERKERKFSNARKLYKKWHKLDPNDCVPLCHLVFVEFEDEKYIDGDSQLDRAIDCCSDSKSIVSELSEAITNSSRYVTKHAFKIVERMCKNSKYIVISQSVLARLKRKKGDLIGARIILKNTIVEFPEDEILQHELNQIGIE